MAVFCFRWSLHKMVDVHELQLQNMESIILEPPQELYRKLHKKYTHTFTYYNASNFHGIEEGLWLGEIINTFIQRW